VVVGCVENPVVVGFWVYCGGGVGCAVDDGCVVEGFYVD